jgi:hypothetical protein
VALSVGAGILVSGPANRAIDRVARRTRHKKGLLAHVFLERGRLGLQDTYVSGVEAPARSEVRYDVGLQGVTA